MSHPDEAPFRNDLGETLAEAWRLLARGVADRRHGFHHPVVATVGTNGRPRARTVILRGVDVAGRKIRFHTDHRAGKIAELVAEPRIALLFYDVGAKAQVRIEGRALLHHADEKALAAFEGSRLMSRVCYGALPAPGTPIDAPDAFSLPEASEEATRAGEANFVAVLVAVESLEWLHLGHAGHRRALFSWPTDTLTAGWLAP
jgi:pyridoxamine 5'-phosphate oxidase